MNQEEQPAQSWDRETPDGDRPMERGWEAQRAESMKTRKLCLAPNGNLENIKEQIFLQVLPCFSLGLTWALCSDLPALPHFPLCR